MKKVVLFINCHPKETSESVWFSFIHLASQQVRSRISKTLIKDFNMREYANKNKIEIGNYCVLNVQFSALLNDRLYSIREYYKNEYEFVGYYLYGTSILTIDRVQFETVINTLKFSGMDHYDCANVIDFLVNAHIKTAVNDTFGIVTSEKYRSFYAMSDMETSKKENKYMRTDTTINAMRVYGNWINIGKASHTIKKVIFNNPATIVFWEDGTKTIVKCTDGDVFDPEKGIAMAFMKKILGNKGRYYNEIKKWLPVGIPLSADLSQGDDFCVFSSKKQAIEQLKKELSEIDIPDWTYDESVIELNRYGEPYDTRLFYAGKQKIVCAGDCYHVRNMKKKNVTAYYTLELALEDGCRPCKHCHGAHKEEK